MVGLRRSVRSLLPWFFPVDIREPDPFIHALRPTQVHVVSCSLPYTSPHVTALCTVHRQNIPFTYWNVPLESLESVVFGFLSSRGNVVVATNLSRDIYQRLRHSQRPLRQGSFGDTGAWSIMAST